MLRGHRMGQEQWKLRQMLSGIVSNTTAQFLDNVLKMCATGLAQNLTTFNIIFNSN